MGQGQSYTLVEIFNTKQQCEDGVKTLGVLLPSSLCNRDLEEMLANKQYPDLSYQLGHSSQRGECRDKCSDVKACNFFPEHTKRRAAYFKATCFYDPVGALLFRDFSAKEVDTKAAPLKYTTTPPPRGTCNDMQVESGIFYRTVNYSNFYVLTDVATPTGAAGFYEPHCSDFSALFDAHALVRCDFGKVSYKYFAPGNDKCDEGVLDYPTDKDQACQVLTSARLALPGTPSTQSNLCKLYRAYMEPFFRTTNQKDIATQCVQRNDREIAMECIPKPDNISWKIFLGIVIPAAVLIGLYVVWRFIFYPRRVRHLEKLAAVKGPESKARVALREKKKLLEEKVAAQEAELEARRAEVKEQVMVQVAKDDVEPAGPAVRLDLVKPRAWPIAVSARVRKADATLKLFGFRTPPLGIHFVSGKCEVGSVVESLEPEGRAEEAGVPVGSLVVSVDGESVVHLTVKELITRIDRCRYSANLGRTVQLGVRETDWAPCFADPLHEGGAVHPGYYHFDTGEYRFKHDPWVEVWIRQRMPSGRPYFESSITGETTWSDPSILDNPSGPDTQVVKIRARNHSGESSDEDLESKVHPIKK